MCQPGMEGYRASDMHFAYDKLTRLPTANNKLTLWREWLTTTAFTVEWFEFPHSSLYSSWASLSTGWLTAGISKAQVNSPTGGDCVLEHGKSFHQLNSICLKNTKIVYNNDLTTEMARGYMKYRKILFQCYAFCCCLFSNDKHQPDLP